MTYDGFGVSGAIWVYSMTLSFVGTACLCLWYCWKVGRLDFDEQPKWDMLNEDNHNARR